MRKPVLNIHHKIYIKENRLKEPSVVLGEYCNCSKTVIQKYLREIKKQVPKSIVSKFRVRSRIGATSFTAEQDKILIENYLKIAEKPLSKIIGKSSCSVRIRRRQLGLVIPKSIRENRKNNTLFKKGHVPTNKGVPKTEWLTPDQLKEQQKNYFKSGHVPHNQKPKNGIISIREDKKTGKKYKYIRIAPNNWVLLSRLNYERHIGPIPKNNIIIFKDGDSLNCHPTNLKAITRREHVIKNAQNYHNLPESLKQVIKLSNKLTSKLRE